MARNVAGASLPAPVKTPNPPGPASLTRSEAPLAVRPAASSFIALGLRQTADGFELVRVDVLGDGACAVTPLRQAEPQRAVAFAYMEQEVHNLYMAGRG